MIQRSPGVLIVVLALVLSAGLAAAAGPFQLADDFRGTLGEMWSLQRIRPAALGFVPDPTAADRPVLAITLRPGDLAQAAGGESTERAELSEARAVVLPVGTEVWYGLSFYVPPDFPVLDRRLVIAQWKQDCGNCALDHSPGVAVRYRRGALSVTVDNAAGRRPVVEDTADIRGRWTQLVVRLRLTPTDAGLLEVWLDGRPAGAYTGPIGFSDDRDQVYFKMGLYRDHLPVPMALLLRHFRRGATRAEVEP
jgi:hypothetical protein